MKRFSVVAFVIFSLTFVLGCGGAAGGSGSSQIRAVHFIPDAPALDVLADFSGDPLATAAIYTETGGYKKIQNVTQNIEVLLNGTSTVISSIAMAPGEGQKLSLFLVGSLASPDYLLFGDNTTVPASGKVKLRLIMASPTAGTVDIYITNPGDPLPTTPTYDNYVFGNNTGYLEGLAGSYRIRITGSNNQTVKLDTGAISLASGVIKTWVLADSAGGGLPLQGVLLQD